ncbi:hypothetical protein F511_22231 [Dorcoceras hygrometricum]|uniref:Uncharacterized protein n=1 Tax=Dorcoceras hygrometricum TaxID=472368 RepID=A0A2Z7CMF7_9LAMI|nr:hypothetical protein F511_22231 [Dorcoceras hygrometricum]
MDRGWRVVGPLEIPCDLAGGSRAGLPGYSAGLGVDPAGGTPGGLLAWLCIEVQNAVVFEYVSLGNEIWLLVNRMPTRDISLIEGSVSAVSDFVLFARSRGVARSVIACFQKSTNSFVVLGLKRRSFEVSAPVYRAACDRWLCNAAFSFLFRFFQRLVLATGLLLRVFSLACFQISLARGWSLFSALVQIPPAFYVSDQTSPMVARRHFVAEHCLVHALVA